MGRLNCSAPRPGAAMRPGVPCAAVTVALMVLAFLVQSGISGCASQVPPSGGPPDTEAPEIIATVPVQGTLNFHGSGFTVGFSEYVDRRTFQESVFLSPSAGTLRFEWGGEEAEVFFGDSLRDRTTYIVTIGTDLKDTRNNALDSAFSFAFSTGDVIDSCVVSGRIHDEKPGGVMVFTYQLDAPPDTGLRGVPDPALRKPDYLTQSGVDGTFRIPHMKPGTYRIIAVRDLFKNLLYDVQTDAFGMATGDIRLTSERPEASGILFRLTTADTMAPFLSGARATDRTHFLLRFNEAIDLHSLRSGGVGIRDTVTGAALDLLDLSPADTSGREFLLTTSAHDSGAAYRISLRSFSDRTGNPSGETGLSVLAPGSALPDTTAPVPVISIPADSARNVPPDEPLRFSFGEAVDTLALGGGLSITDSAGAPYPGHLTWLGGAMAAFTPARDFTPGAWYGISIVLDSLRDLAGNGYGDSVLVRRFRIVEEKNLGSIAGVVSMGSSTGERIQPAGPVYVSARSLASKGMPPVVTTADTAGNFFLGNLREGSYQVSAFEDADSNGRYSAGSPHPVKFSERFSVYPDTLKVRPRWPLEGVSVRFPR